MTVPAPVLDSLEIRVDDPFLFDMAAALTEVPADVDWKERWIDAIFSLIHATAEVEDALGEGTHMFTVTGVTECADLFYDTDYDEGGWVRGIELFVQTCESEIRLARVYYGDFSDINSPRYLPWRRDITSAPALLRAVIEDLNHELREVRKRFAA